MDLTLWRVLIIGVFESSYFDTFFNIYWCFDLIFT